MVDADTPQRSILLQRLDAHTCRADIAHCAGRGAHESCDFGVTAFGHWCPQALAKRFLDPARGVAGRVHLQHLDQEVGLLRAVVDRHQLETAGQLFVAQVRISAIVDGCFSLIVDGETALPEGRWGSAQALGLNVAQSSTISLKWAAVGRALGSVSGSV